VGVEMLPSMGRSGKRMQRGGLPSGSLVVVGRRGEAVGLGLAGVVGSWRPAMSSHELMTSAASSSGCAPAGGLGLDLEGRESGGGGGGGGGGGVDLGWSSEVELAARL
jgi:hypothetical protein